MNSVLKNRVSDLLLVAGTVGLAFILLAAIWQFKMSADAAVTSRLEDYDRLRSIAAYEEELNQFSSGNGSSPLAGMVVEGSTASAASAAMLMSLSQHPASAGVQILRTAELPARSLGAVLTAGQSMEFSGTWRATLEFIAAIETHLPELAIDKLVIRAPFEGAQPPESEPVYSVEVQIHGVTGISPQGQVPVAP